jgi:cytochrome P450
MDATMNYLRSDEYLANPYKLYSAIRNSHDVYFAKDLGHYWLMRHSDCSHLLSSRDFGKDIEESFSGASGYSGPSTGMDDPYRSILFLDPPRHTKLRQLVTKAFTPKAIESLRPFIREISEELARTRHDSPFYDIIQDFAGPIPAFTIARMLGVPREDMTKFKKWSDDAVLALDVAASKEEEQLAADARLNLSNYFQKLIERKKLNVENDVLSDLITAEESGSRLSYIELIVMCNLLLIAGHETTTNLIGNGFLALLKTRDQFDMLRDDRTLLKSAVEELLRFDPPVQRDSRALYKDATFSGQILPRGSTVTAIIGSANRDPDVFDNPDSLDITRKDNPHLSFSKGIHYCLGAQLAKMEGEIAFDVLCDRFKTPELYEEPVWRRNSNMHGMETLKIKA